MSFATAWFNGVGIIEVGVPQFNYQHSTQRENDSRTQTVKTGMTGYLEMKNVVWNYSWTGNLGGSLNQTFRLRDSSNNVVFSTSGGGGSGQKTFDITGLDPSQTYNIQMYASSSGGSYMERAGRGNISYTYLTKP